MSRKLYKVKVEDFRWHEDSIEASSQPEAKEIAREWLEAGKLALDKTEVVYHIKEVEGYGGE